MLGIRIFAFAGLGAVLWLAAAAQSPGGNAAWRPRVPLGLDLYMPVPESNPLTQKKAELGRKLFFDPILSRDLSLSCAGCHQPEHAFTDARRVAVGVFGRTGTRNAPTLVNRAWGRAHFWDGREAALESTVLKPIQNPDELDMMLEEAVARLRAHAEYPLLFQQAFGREPAAEDLAHALASFVRSILSGDAPVDRYMNGDRAALTEEQLLGLRIFRGKGNCVACHVGPNFTDEQFHNTGVAWRDGALQDAGRFATSGREADRGAFKTPTLRNVALTAPYMHDGSLAALEDVVEFYDRGGNANPHLDAEIRPLHLAPEEKRALITFLRSLTGSLPTVGR